MSHSPRVRIPDAIHHFTVRGNNKREVFVDVDDRKILLALLRSVNDLCGWSCMSYCLMNNHIHLLIHAPDPDVGRGMQLLLGRFSRVTNQRHGRSDHLWGARYHDVIVSSDFQLAAAFRYIAMNPVKAGLCAQPGDWAWSAHNALVGAVPCPKHLNRDLSLSYFEGDVGVYESLFE